MLSIYRSVPAASALKWLVAFVLLLNVRSFPLAWHYRVFLPLVKIRLRYLSLRARLLLSSQRQKEAALERWFTSITPVGSDPFKRGVVYKTWASIDDCDFNLHLSNSSYPKTLDCARFKAALDFYPQFLRAGGIIPLAGTHFHFIREIPIFSKYEIRLNIGAWDDKWLYVVGRFVTKPKHRKQNKSDPANTKPIPENSQALFRNAISTPADATSSTNGSPKNSSITDLSGLAAKLVPAEEPDGAILHTISISQCCLKLGRITVPPAIVIASNGLTGSGLDSLTPYSHVSPPPHWKNVEAIMSKKAGGSIKALHNFYKGGWRDVPLEERWWNDALGAIEQQRKERLEAIEGVRKGMEGARTFC